MLSGFRDNALPPNHSTGPLAGGAGAPSARRRLAWFVRLCSGRFLLGLSWERILSDYDVVRGGLMVFGLAFLALSPLIAARFRMCGSMHRAMHLIAFEK